MSRWKDAFEAQQCLQRVQECLGLLESANTDGLPPNAMENYSRLLKVLKVLEVRFTNIDPELFSPTTWNSLGPLLNSCVKQLRAFSQARDAGLLQNANNSVDEMLNVLRPLDGAGSDASRATTEAADAFLKKVIEEFGRVQSRAAEVKGQLDSLSNEVTQAKARLEQNNLVLEQQKGRLDQSIAEFQRQFSQAESTRSQEFGAAARKMGQDFEGLTKSFAKKFGEASSERNTEHEQLTQQQRQQSDEHLNFLKKRENEVNEIFGAIGASSLSGHFRTTADNDAKAANRLRLVALALMTAMIVIGGMAFYHSLQHPQLDWKIFAFRLGTTIIIAVPAFYAAQESAKHRQRERENRKLHLELASIDAYLVLLPEAKRHELKEKLTEKFFGRPDAFEKGDDVSKHALFQLLSSVVKDLTKAR